MQDVQMSEQRVREGIPRSERIGPARRVWVVRSEAVQGRHEHDRERHGQYEEDWRVRRQTPERSLHDSQAEQQAFEISTFPFRASGMAHGAWQKERSGAE